jgi:hypothetical protein
MPLTRTNQTHHDRLLARPHLLQSLRDTQPSSSRLAPLGWPLCAAVAAAAAIAAALLLLRLLLLLLLEVLVLVASVLLLVLVLLRPLCTVSFCRRSCCYVLALPLPPQLVFRGEGVWHLCVAGGAGEMRRVEERRNGEGMGLAGCRLYDSGQKHDRST